MRVIAGTYKGHRLAAPRRRTTRPTGDRVREAVFNLLGPLEGEQVLDLYSGSGALGIEALSRGAATATFIDSDAAAVNAIRANLERLGIEHGGMRSGKRARVVRAGVPAFLRAAGRARERWSLVFCDPPYRLAHRLARDLDELLPPVLADEARVVCESPHRQATKLAMPLVTERRYGDTSIAVYTRAAEPYDA